MAVVEGHGICEFRRACLVISLRSWLKGLRFSGPKPLPTAKLDYPGIGGSVKTALRDLEPGGKFSDACRCYCEQGKKELTPDADGRRFADFQPPPKEGT